MIKRIERRAMRLVVFKISCRKGREGKETHHKLGLRKLNGSPDLLRHLVLDPVLLNPLPLFLRLQFVWGTITGLGGGEGFATARH